MKVDEMWGFENPKAPLEVTQVDPRYWATTHDLVFHSSYDTTIVPKGWLTDFATIPFAFRGLLNVSGKHNPATIIHDYLCVEADKGRYSRRIADNTFYEALTAMDLADPRKGDDLVRRVYMWVGVRWGALPRHPLGVLPDLWIILPLSLLALPIIGPAVVITQLTRWVIAAAKFVVGLGDRWNGHRRRKGRK